MFKLDKLVVVDCGRSTIKFTDNPDEVSLFPAQMTPVDLEQFFSLPSFSEKKPMLFQYKGQNWVIGDFAMADGMKRSSMVDKDYIEESFLYYLVAIALKKGDGYNITLGLNLTFNSFRYKDYLKEKLIGQHTIKKWSHKESAWKTISFNIEKVGVLYQGWSSLIAVSMNKDLTLKDQYKSFSNTEGMVIDVGRRTIDVILLKTMAPVDGGTFDYGTYAVYNRVCSDLRKTYSLNKTVSEVEEYHLSGRVIKKGSDVISIKGMVEDHLNRISEEIQSVFKENYFQATPEYVFLVGGGAPMFKPIFDKIYNFLVVPAYPQLLNAKGMYMFLGAK